MSRDGWIQATTGGTWITAEGRDCWDSLVFPTGWRPATVPTPNFSRPVLFRDSEREALQGRRPCRKPAGDKIHVCPLCRSLTILIADTIAESDRPGQKASATKLMGIPIVESSRRHKRGILSPASPGRNFLRMKKVAVFSMIHGTYISQEY
jgi:hypothetical protein